MAELRCGSQLFGKVTGDNLIEVACRDCRAAARRADPQVVLVLHLFDLDGRMVGTQALHLIRQAR